VSVKKGGSAEDQPAVPAQGGDKALIAAVGAGRMGRGIAITFAYAGYSVSLIDLKERTPAEFESLRSAASQEVLTTLSMLAEFGMLGEDDVHTTAARVSYHARDACVETLAEADIIFEGVPESLEAKQGALAFVSKHCRKDAVVASTTSTFLSDALQPFVSEPGRFLNAHWLNPAFLVPLVELSPGADTDTDTTERLKTLLESMGKVPVVCAASPGYIVPRIQALAMNEAARMVEEGVASVEDYYASRYMVDATGEKRHASPKIIETHMQDGHTGMGARKGFLDYSNMDVPEYQRQRLAAFVAMLRHIDKMPPPAT